MSILLSHQIKLDKIKYGKVEELNGKKIVYIYYEALKNKLIIQTPELLNCLGSNNKNYYNEIVLPLYGKNPEKFIKFLTDLDNKIIEDVSNNFMHVFGEKENIHYKPLIKKLGNKTESFNDNLLNKYQQYFKYGGIKVKITHKTKIMENGEEIDMKQDFEVK